MLQSLNRKTFVSEIRTGTVDAPEEKKEQTPPSDEAIAGSSPLVTVIIPCYNSAPYLQQCLDSIFSQTRINWELICIDDGSSDNTVQILEKNADSHPGMHVAIQDNSGPGKTRNRALDRATGKYILFVDSDDFIDSKLLETSVVHAEKYNADIVVWDIWFYDDRYGNVRNPPQGIVDFSSFECGERVFSWKDNSDAILLNFQNWPWNKLFKRDFVVANDLRFQEDVFRTEDVMFTCPALIKAERITCIPERLSYYRVMRQDSAMATKDPYALDFLTAILRFKGFLEDEGVYDRVRRSFVNWALSSAFYNLRTLNTFKAFSEVYGVLRNRGFEELGVLGFEKDYFFSPWLYDDLQKTLLVSPEEFLFDWMKVSENAREDANNVSENLQASIADLKTDVLRLNGIVEDQAEWINNQIKQLEDQAKQIEEQAKVIEKQAKQSEDQAIRIEHEQKSRTAAEQELEALHNTPEQRVGAAICSIPRIIQKGLRKHG